MQVQVAAFYLLFHHRKRGSQAHSFLLTFTLARLSVSCGRLVFLRVLAGQLLLPPLSKLGTTRLVLSRPDLICLIHRIFRDVSVDDTGHLDVLSCLLIMLIDLRLLATDYGYLASLARRLQLLLVIVAVPKALQLGISLAITQRKVFILLGRLFLVFDFLPPF